MCFGWSATGAIWDRVQLRPQAASGWVGGVKGHGKEQGDELRLISFLSSTFSFLVPPSPFGNIWDVFGRFWAVLGGLCLLKFAVFAEVCCVFAWFAVFLLGLLCFCLVCCVFAWFAVFAEVTVFLLDLMCLLKFAVFAEVRCVLAWFAVFLLGLLCFSSICCVFAWFAVLRSALERLGPQNPSKKALWCLWRP